jgi:predicted acylesterase/phospholipase RssA
MPLSASRSVSLWWQNSERVERLTRGVFEGGGAKGILYVGALEGMLRRKLWFSEVAGASAGAIVATLVASGMEPRQMRSEMEKALDALSPPKADERVASPQVRRRVP